MPPPQHFVVDQNWPFGTKISHLGPKKPPGTVKSLKWPFWSFSAPGGHWEKRKQIYIMTLVQLFSIYMTSIHPRHLPDTLRHHPDTARHPQTPSRHPSDTPIFGLHAATGRKSNIWLSWYLFNWFQFIRHLHTPDICLTSSDTIQTLPDTLRHHPDTPQKPPYLTCMRPLGERVISEYHDIYSTVFNFSDNCFTQTSVRHAQTLSRNCQTPSTPSRHPSNAPILL